ncbi:hypothetical protein [Winogradskyella wichelsiae]|uniref:hypothetical protein n=1 Tax=Winogradskyella wichelsiae TaxID=2697007 RepID=UPI0015C7242E|nr:hypothetical protein [Winogradskyella wichelsiae]
MRKIKLILTVIAPIIFLVSCFGQEEKTNTIPSLAPIKVAEDQFVYHFTSQKDLDTLYYEFQLKNTERSFSFQLENPNSNYAQDTIVKVWSAAKIKNFEDKINNRATFLDMTIRERMNDLGPQFRDYCKQGAMKDRLATVKYFSDNSSDSGDDVLIYGLNLFKSKGPFDYFITYGNDSIKQETKKIILDRIPRMGVYSFPDYAPFFIDDTSDTYYNTLQQLRKDIDTIQIKRVQLARLEDYIQYVAPEMTRLKGLEHIDEILETTGYVLKNLTRSHLIDNFKEDVEPTFRNLFRFNEIDEITKKNISNRLRKLKIDLDAILENKKRYTLQLDLDLFVNKAKQAGLLKEDLSINQRYAIARDYCSFGDTYAININDFLKTIPVIFTYKSSHFGSGHLTTYRTPDYDSIMDKFMIAALADIPDFYTETYLYKSSNGVPYYALFLGNKDEGYVIELKDKELSDFNHEAVSLLFNTVLKLKNIDKQFSTKLNEPEHKYEVIYEKPGVLKIFLNSVNHTINDLDYKNI